MLKKLFEYKAWADERTLLACAEINDHTITEPANFILQQLNHMIIVEDLFRARLLRQPPPHTATNTKELPSFSELSARLKESNQCFQTYVAEQTNVTLKDVLKFEFADGKQGAMSVEEILFHIVNHGSYHRGNIAHALDQAGIPHPVDGLGVFLHELEPSRRAH